MVRRDLIGDLVGRSVVLVKSLRHVVASEAQLQTWNMQGFAGSFYPALLPQEADLATLVPLVYCLGFDRIFVLFVTSRRDSRVDVTGFTRISIETGHRRQRTQGERADGKT